MGDDEKIPFGENKDQIDTLLNKGKTLLYIGFDGKLLGTITLADKVRENSKRAIERLKELGAKKIVMLTGDTRKKADMIAGDLGIDEVFADLLPTDKARIVKELKDSGDKVVFVGDGIHDAPALISADVGISMSKGADIAKATADVSLLKDDIEAVADSKELANKTMKLINY